MPGIADLVSMLGSTGAGPSAAAPAMTPSSPPGSPALGQLAQFQSEMAPGKGEEEALMNASIQLGIALKAMYLRSPKAAKLILSAMRDIQSAREELQKVASAPMQSPPSLGADFLSGLAHAGVGALMSGGMSGL